MASFCDGRKIKKNSSRLWFLILWLFTNGYLLLAQNTNDTVPEAEIGGIASETELEDIAILQKIINSKRQKNERDLRRLERKYTEEVQEPDEVVQERLSSKLKVSGSVATKYVTKIYRDETDHDLTTSLNLELEHLVPDTVHFTMQGAMVSDLASSQYRRSKPSKPFRDIYDSYDGPVQAKLYQAYFTFDNVIARKSLIQLGRQEYYLDRTYYFDGAFASIQLHDMVTVVGLAGLANYDFKGPKGEDWLIGSGLEFSPWVGSELGIYYLHLAEDSENEGLHDDIFMIKGRHKLFDYVNLNGYFTILSEQTSELDVQANFFYPDFDLQISLQGHLLINRLSKVTTGADYFTSFMMTEQPYQQLDFSIAKGFGQNWHLEAGYTGRRLDDSNDYGPFNREFSRFHLTGTASDYPRKGLSASLTGECWLADGPHTFYGVDGEVTYRPNDQWRASAGVDYSLYKYVYYEQDEKTDVYTLFVRCRYQLTKNLEARGRYECEFSDSETTHIAELEARIVF